MKIDKIKILNLKSNKLSVRKYPAPSYFENGFIIMKIYTNEGIVGYGEPNPYHIDISKLNKLIKDFIPNSLEQPFFTTKISKLSYHNMNSLSFVCVCVFF